MNDTDILKPLTRPGMTSPARKRNSGEANPWQVRQKEGTK